MLQGLDMGLTWTDLLGMPLQMLLGMVDARLDMNARSNARAKGKDVRDATAKDIKNFI